MEDESLPLDAIFDSENYFLEVDKALTTVVQNVIRAMEKVNKADPTWDDLKDLLSEDEYRTFLTFVTWRSAN